MAQPFEKRLAILYKRAKRVGNDRNSRGEMQPGQIFSIEPGIYIKGKAGYRHSDTILITESGVKLITYYPRDLESLIIEAS